MIKYFLILCLGISFSLGETTVTKDWLQNKPRSYYKDFYIWRYLNQNISAKDAIWALGEAKNVNNKLFYRYAKKLNHKETSRVVSCMKMSTKKLIGEDATCIELGLTPYEATQLSTNELEQTIKKIANEYPAHAKILEIIKSPLSFQKLINSDNETFYNTFLEVGSAFRANKFNYNLPKKTIDKLRDDIKNFKRLVRKIVLSPKLTKLQESLLTLDAKNLDHKSQFYLAINAIKHNKYTQAIEFLEESNTTAYFKFDKDKVDFWLYQVTNNKKILEKLASSWDINIYSLYAKEQTKTPITNVVFDFPTNNSTSKYEINNPFAWLDILKETKKLDDSKMEYYQSLFNTKLTSGHLAFILERYHKYKKSFFPSPYDKYINKYTKKRQALINAIARQESRFIPTSISTSYALGVMQIMPFLSKALAKEMNIVYNIDEQLDAKTNIEFGNKHLTWLENRLKHPLFIAYAYNGGIGFTKKMLKSGIFKKGKFEPYLSMELVPYDESKRYAKKVLANYIIYHNQILGEELNVTSILENLDPPYQK